MYRHRVITEAELSNTGLYSLQYLIDYTCVNNYYCCNVKMCITATHACWYLPGFCMGPPA